jgi:hypothetical protein
MSLLYFVKKKFIFLKDIAKFIFYFGNMNPQMLKEGDFLIFLINRCAGFKGARQWEEGLELGFLPPLLANRDA